MINLLRCWDKRRKCKDRHNRKTSSSAIAEKPRCRMGQFWPKVEDDMLQTLY